MSNYTPPNPGQWKQPTQNMAQPDQGSFQLPQFTGVGPWLRQQWSKLYWKIFLIGAVIYVIALQALEATANDHLAPLFLFIASLLIPITFVTFCWEQGTFTNIPGKLVGLAFIFGAIVGILTAGVLENALLPPMTQLNFVTALLVGLLEEGSKLVAALWFLHYKQYRSSIAGLIIGVAVGMGFAAVETAGYGFNTFVNTIIILAADPNVQVTISQALHQALLNMVEELNVRMALTIFGHGIWTAIVCTAIWRERGNAFLKLTGGVWATFGIAVLLHGLWDTAGSLLFEVLIGLIGLLVLRFFIIDGLAQLKFGFKPPLVPALKYYFKHLNKWFPYPSPASGAPVTPPPGGQNQAPFAATSTVQYGTRQGMNNNNQIAPPVAPGTIIPPQVVMRKCFYGHMVSDGAARFCPFCGAAVQNIPVQN
jgi:protease PrsW